MTGPDLVTPITITTRPHGAGIVADVWAGGRLLHTTDPPRRNGAHAAVCDAYVWALDRGYRQIDEGPDGRRVTGATAH